MIEKQPEEITIAHLEVVIMPNGELISMGKRIGFFKDYKKYLSHAKSAIIKTKEL